MRRHNNKDIHLTAFKGLVPLGMDVSEGKTFAIRASNGWHPSSNYSWQLRSSMMDKINLSQDQTKHCNSGGTNYTYRGAMIAESRSGVLLTLPVTDPLGNKLLLVNDQFDTPRHRTQWRAMRAHFRKAMYEIIERRTEIKMVKVPHEFLQQFKVQYNYVPTWAQIHNLQKRIVHQATENV